MDTRDYLRALRRYWWAFLACVLIGVWGAFGYNRVTYLDQAKASVAVLSPLISSKASGTTEAQVSFDAIIKSNTLASLVGAQMNESEQTVSNNLSITIDTGSGSSPAATTSPLYIVHGRDIGVPRAEMLVNIAIDEASKLFVKINATDGGDIKAALASQESEVTGEVASAQSALDKFSADNNAADLPNRLQQERGKVDQLSLTVYAAGALAQSTQLSRDYSAYNTLSNDLRKEQKELNRLTGLLPEYHDLQYQLTAAQARSSAFDVQSQDLLVNTLLPAQVQVKVLDSAAEESQLLFLLLTYALGAVAGIILGLAAIYVLALVYRRPATVQEVARAMGAPILVRIPRAAA